MHGQATEIIDPLTPVPGLTDIYAESLCSGGARRCIFDLGEAVPMSVGEYRITKLSAVGSSCGWQTEITGLILRHTRFSTAEAAERLPRRDLGDLYPATLRPGR